MSCERVVRGTGRVSGPRPTRAGSGCVVVRRRGLPLLEIQITYNKLSNYVNIGTAISNEKDHDCENQWKSFPLIYTININGHDSH